MAWKRKIENIYIYNNAYIFIFSSSWNISKTKEKLKFLSSRRHITRFQIIFSTNLSITSRCNPTPRSSLSFWSLWCMVWNPKALKNYIDKFYRLQVAHNCEEPTKSTVADKKRRFKMLDILIKTLELFNKKDSEIFNGHQVFGMPIRF